jgi:SAM-dependent methyltransferase
MSIVSKTLHDHYNKTFQKYGACSQGVDWGSKEKLALARQYKMLNVVKNKQAISTILDVGCGYGALLDVIKIEKLDLVYTGIDLVEIMIESALKKHLGNNFICGDILNIDIGDYDYVVCNGILTQKMDISTLVMNKFAQELIKKMYQISNYGVAFNVMTTYVNFQKDNLYYRNPAELVSWCMSELTPHVNLDSAYDPWYEYTIYLYKPETIRDK